MRKLGKCGRCFDGSDATTVERLAFGTSSYDLQLCEKHADMFRRDMYAWARGGTLHEPQRPVRAALTDAERARRGTVVKAYIPSAREPEPTPVREQAQPTVVQTVPPKVQPTVQPTVQPAARRPEPARPAVAATQLNQPRLRLAAAPLPPGFAEWSFSEHAMDRQVLRSISRDEALWCAVAPDITQPGKADGVMIHTRGRVRVVLNPSQKRIITVIDRSVTTEEEMDRELANAACN